MRKTCLQRLRRARLGLILGAQALLLIKVKYNPCAGRNQFKSTRLNSSLTLLILQQNNMVWNGSWSAMKQTLEDIPARMLGHVYSCWNLFNSSTAANLMSCLQSRIETRGCSVHESGLRVEYEKCLLSHDASVIHSCALSTSRYDIIS